MSLISKPVKARRDLVLVHGWGMHAGVWRPWLPMLEASWRVHALELPGHGDSPFNGAGADLAAWAGHVLAKAPRQAVWAGWSLGGQLAMQAALQEPDRVSGLFLIGATPRFVAGSDWPNAMAQSTFEQFGDQLLRDVRKTLLRFLAIQVLGAEREREILAILKKATQAKPLPAQAALEAGLRLLAENDLRGRLGELRVPVAWLFGLRDSLVPAASISDLQELRTQDCIEIVSKAGHAPFLSHPEASLAALNQFAENLA